MFRNLDKYDFLTFLVGVDIKEKEAEWYPAKAYNFDDVFFNRDDFAERFKAINPECMRKKDVFQDEFEHMQNNFSTRDAHIDGNQRKVSLVWKLFRFGKKISHVVRILEEEINNHNEHSLFEIVLWDDSLRDHYEAEKVLNDVANHLPEYKSCLGCAHFSQIRGYYDQMSCRIRKNGPVGDHSFQVERGRNCSFFQYTRPGYIPGKVKLWSPSLNNMDGGQWEDIDPDYLDDNPKGLFP